MNHKRFIKFIIIGIVTILIFIALYPRQFDPAIKAIADNYVKDLVGNSEFEKNYEFDYKKSEKCHDTDQFGGCYIYYKFLPSEKYSESEFIFFYTFTDNHIKIANNNVPVTLPSCERDKNKCDFKVTLKELQEIARQRFLNDKYFEFTMYNDEIVAEVSSCNLQTGANRKKIYVDLQDGNILWEGQNSECQGII